MTDPITRTARRQNLLDRLAEHLTEWGCPADLAGSRALAVLHDVEAAGWSLPAHDAPPLQGRGSTDEGRARARLMWHQAFAGCRCDGDRLGDPAHMHDGGCPVRTRHDATASGTE